MSEPLRPSRCPSCGGDGVECCNRPPCGGCGCLAHDGGSCFTGPARDAIFAAEQEMARLKARLDKANHKARYPFGE